MFPIGSDRFRSKAAALPDFSAGGGGEMDDHSKRLSALEGVVGDVRVNVAEIRGQLPALASRADLNALRADMHAMETRMVNAMGSLETRMVTAMGDIREQVASALAAIDARSTAAENRLIKWIIGTGISTLVLACALTQAISRFM